MDFRDLVHVEAVVTKSVQFGKDGLVEFSSASKSIMGKVSFVASDRLVVLLNSILGGGIFCLRCDSSLDSSWPVDQKDGAKHNENL